MTEEQTEKNVAEEILEARYQPRWIDIYIYLKNVATETDKPITYGQLSAFTAMSGEKIPRQYLSAPLKAVHNACMENNEPDLTAYVVSTHTNEPSAGYAGNDAGGERMRCHQYWKART